MNRSFLILSLFIFHINCQEFPYNLVYRLHYNQKLQLKEGSKLVCEVQAAQSELKDILEATSCQLFVWAHKNRDLLLSEKIELDHPKEIGQFILSLTAEKKEVKLITEKKELKDPNALPK